MSEKSSHTPGPWSIDTRGAVRRSDAWATECKVMFGPRRNQGNVIAIVHMGGRGALSMAVDDVAANARLIAAAPELLEALTNLHDAGVDAQNIMGNAGPPITKDQCIYNLIEALSAARATINGVKGGNGVGR